MASPRDIHTSPARFVDDLLQGTVLFVMDILNNKTLKRDAAFYRRGCRLVDTLKEHVAELKVSDAFTEHILHAQCCLIDEVVLNTAPLSDNQIWLNTPLQARYLDTIHAGEGVPERLRTLLRQPAPDMRLLIMYQRIFAMGFGRYSPEFKEARHQLMASLDALVPVSDIPLSAPLLVEYRPAAREGLLRSRLFHLVLLAIITVALGAGLSHSLSAFLHTSFSG
ncbi:DotU/TssL family secretion system protein [Enterobacteriaceae bacterium LUAb1]